MHMDIDIHTHIVLQIAEGGLETVTEIYYFFFSASQVLKKHCELDSNVVLDEGDRG